MVFSSTLFIFLFLPITLGLYFLASLTQKVHIMNVVLLIASIIFYGWGGLKPLIVLLVTISINYILTILMDRYGRTKKLLFILLLMIDIGNLFYFKYFNFFVENTKDIVELVGVDIFQGVAYVALPIGISFYTFQIISYVVDVYMGKVEVQQSLIKLMLYVTMFPQLIAGPIVRYSDINEEINSRNITVNDVDEGIKRFIVGFFKKVLLANSMGGMADTVFGMVGSINTVYAWLGAICYTFQIYYDFSAYSDMAIGIGRMLGFHFNENFDSPYISKSIKEFWRRWHISLSSWFRDYVYIPLGGNRKGLKRTYLNLLVVFLLTGIWHGAAWSFIVWGLYHGMFLLLERFGFEKILKKIHPIFCHIYTMFVVIIGWVFFRADNLNMAMKYLKNMFSFNFVDFTNYEILARIDSLFIVCFVIAIIFSLVKKESIKRLVIWKNGLFEKICYLFLWVLSVLYLTGTTYNPFIYFKF